jgi:hypothetical protein
MASLEDITSAHYSKGCVCVVFFFASSRPHAHIISHVVCAPGRYTKNISDDELVAIRLALARNRARAICL